MQNRNQGGEHFYWKTVLRVKLAEEPVPRKYRTP